MKLHGLGLRPDGHAALGFVTAAKAAVQYENAAATADDGAGVQGGGYVERGSLSDYFQPQIQRVQGQLQVSELAPRAEVDLGVY
jgi:hypothetical protein